MIVRSFKLMNSESFSPYIKEDTAYFFDGNGRTPDDIYEMLRKVLQMDQMAEEYVYLLCYTAKMRLTAIFELSHGSVFCAPISSREIMIRALLIGAVNIVIAHNHPSGDPAPSKADRDCCCGIADACRIMNILFADFLIVGGGRYYSFRAHDMLA